MSSSALFWRQERSSGESNPRQDRGGPLDRRSLPQQMQRVGVIGFDREESRGRSRLGIRQPSGLVVLDGQREGLLGGQWGHEKIRIEPRGQLKPEKAIPFRLISLFRRNSRSRLKSKRPATGLGLAMPAAGRFPCCRTAEARNRENGALGFLVREDRAGAGIARAFFLFHFVSLIGRQARRTSCSLGRCRTRCSSRRRRRG